MASSAAEEKWAHCTPPPSSSTPPAARRGRRSAATKQRREEAQWRDPLTRGAFRYSAGWDLCASESPRRRDRGTGASPPGLADVARQGQQGCCSSAARGD